ncbi:CD92 [Mytilus edulis]|uniref:Choline transporter-like protein n=1 Tax=Mytilus edulis TaxID=6550 RepID=A0A8S3RWT3_MYTED|nr:CD92 [Mytilus edulis]
MLFKTCYTSQIVAPISALVTDEYSVEDSHDRYHLGSAAFGSLIITIVFAFRVFVNFIHNRLKNKTGSIVEFFLKCFGCCLWCFEKFISFLNSNAYVEIAITGYGFCHSARRAFKIVVGNALRLAAINSVGSFTLFLGKLAPLSVIYSVRIKIDSELLKQFRKKTSTTIRCFNKGDGQESASDFDSNFVMALN